jgi:hypothetical protein
MNLFFLKFINPSAGRGLHCTEGQVVPSQKEMFFHSVGEGCGIKGFVCVGTALARGVDYPPSAKTVSGDKGWLVGGKGRVVAGIIV